MNFAYFASNISTMFASADLDFEWRGLLHETVASEARKQKRQTDRQKD